MPWSPPVNPADVALLSERAFEEERLVVLRRRVTWFTVVVGLIVLVMAVFASIVAVAIDEWEMDRTARLRMVVQYIFGAGIVAVPAWLLPHTGHESLARLRRRVAIVLVVGVVAQQAGATVIADAINLLLDRLDVDIQVGAIIPLAVIYLALHTVAALLVPWRPVEALRPTLIVAIVILLGSLIEAPRHPGVAGARTMLFLVAGVPGLLVTWLRRAQLHEYLALRVIRGRYEDVRRDLATARRIQESVFPAPVHGPVTLAFRYEPMDQIGGDYLDVVMRRDGKLLCTVVDVAGHGIAAALAVNRLHGEAKRLASTDEALGPGELLAGLNAYSYHVLAEEQMYSTAMAIEVDPRARRFCYASAGHPPALLLRRDGHTEQHGSTSIMLGVVDGDEFRPEEQTVDLEPGDRLLITTDGAYERRDMRGEQLGLDGLLREIRLAAASPVAASLDGLLDGIVARLNAFRDGEPEDDTIVVGIECSEGGGTSGVG